uniref:Uncharacterized protein n=1 Tax=Strigamia maritima TaxID=126957 RepID=T1JDC3_STRMM
MAQGVKSNSLPPSGHPGEAEAYFSAELKERTGTSNYCLESDLVSRFHIGRKGKCRCFAKLTDKMEFDGNSMLIIDETGFTYCGKALLHYIRPHEVLIDDWLSSGELELVEK